MTVQRNKKRQRTDATDEPRERATDAPRGRAASRADARVALLRELADPLRLSVINRLTHTGPATVSRLAAELDVPLPQLSNHLRRLREAGLVSVQRSGRHATYELADPGLEVLLPLLDRLTGRFAERASDADAVPSRTCYDHLAGRIGVEIYRALRERDAVRDRPDGIVELGPEAAAVFAALGVDVAAIRPGRRRLAFECLDATEAKPHLAGALGDALAEALIDRGWIRREHGSRAIHATPRGAQALRATLGVAR
jgi:DNA-binding transcriptional ArsR family regulator